MLAEAFHEAALFNSLEHALSFALRHDHSHVQQSTAARMAVKSITRSIVEMDGPGESGVIRRAVASLGTEKASILVARFATKEIVCACGRPCCSGKIEAPEYAEAVAYLALSCIGIAPKSAASFKLRKRIVENYFDKKERPIAKMADEAGVHRNTASEWSNRIKSHLRPAEKIARSDIEGLLRASGIVGEQ